jgi:heme/copper-type cytochrome/quinol oxidase subunit 2
MKKKKLKLKHFVQSKPFRITITAIILLILLTTAIAASAPAGETIWTKAKAIMQDVYSQILTISTIAAVVTAAVALMLMNFSKNTRTVDESRAWLKRIIISWAILNGLGFIMAYVTPFFTGGKWTG